MRHEEFSYLKEMKQLANMNHIQIKDGLRIHDQRYKEIIEPFYSWVLRLNMLNKLNFDALIKNRYNTIVIEISPTVNDDIPVISIPPNVNHLILEPRIDVRINMPNPESMIINSDTYRDIVTIIHCDILNTNIKLYDIIEDLGISIITKIIKDTEFMIGNQDFTKVQELYKRGENANILLLISIMERHLRLLGVTPEEHPELYQELRPVTRQQNIINMVQKNLMLENTLRNMREYSQQLEVLKHLKHQIKQLTA